MDEQEQYQIIALSGGHPYPPDQLVAAQKGMNEYAEQGYRISHCIASASLILIVMTKQIPVKRRERPDPPPLDRASEY